MSALRLDSYVFYPCSEASKKLYSAAARQSTACQLPHGRSLTVPVQAASQPFVNTRRRMPKSGKPPAYFANDLSKAPLADGDLADTFRNAVYRSLQDVEQGMLAGRGIQGHSIYTGKAGVAYMLLRLAESLQQSQIEPAQHSQQGGTAFTSASLLNQADAYNDLSQGSKHPKRVTFLEGHPGRLAVQTAVASLKGNTAQAQQCIQELEAWGDIVLQMPSTECEVLYGRSGFIHALLFARKYVGSSHASQQLIKQLLQQIVEEGQRGSAELKSMDPNSKWTLMWSWHGSYYLGGAHGVCGILLTLMQCYPELEEIYPKQALPLIMGGLAGVVGQTLPSGNLLSSLGSENDKYVQWCHGAPGFVPVLAKAYQLLDEVAVEGADEAKSQILTAAKNAADVIWERGLLTKGLGLCHGISGNAYAFLSLYSITSDAIYKHRAEQFGLFMIDQYQQLKHVPDAPLSLYEGVGGAACFWMDLAVGAVSAPFPGYEL